MARPRGHSPASARTHFDPLPLSLPPSPPLPSPSLPPLCYPRGRKKKKEKKKDFFYFYFYFYKFFFGSCCCLGKRGKILTSNFQFSIFGFRFSIPKVPKIPELPELRGLRGRSREKKKVFST
jgi:hypothetical protein